MKKKFLYWMVKLGGSAKSPYEIEVNVTWRPGDKQGMLETVAEAAAENFHSEHDGWECSWPLTFSIADEDKKFLGDVEVEREYSADFSGRVV